VKASKHMPGRTQHAVDAERDVLTILVVAAV
jgi:hypothetical protein